MPDQGYDLDFTFTREELPIQTFFAISRTARNRLREFHNLHPGKRLACPSELFPKYGLFASQKPAKIRKLRKQR